MITKKYFSYCPRVEILHILERAPLSISDTAALHSCKLIRGGACFSELTACELNCFQKSHSKNYFFWHSHYKHPTH